MPFIGGKRRSEARQQRARVASSPTGGRGRRTQGVQAAAVGLALSLATLAAAGSAGAVTGAAGPTSVSHVGQLKARPLGAARFAATSRTDSPSAKAAWDSFQSGCATDVLACGTTQAETGQPLPPLVYGPATTYDSGLGSYYPHAWGQLQANQAHDPVFSVTNPTVASLLSQNAWAAPLTGDEFLRLARGFSRYGSNGGESWGAEAAQWLGNVTGVSVVDGIVFAEESNNQIFALDALTGIPIWSAQTVNSDMGDALFENIAGTPMVFVAAGDVGFTLDHALDYGSAKSVSPAPTVRGANFSAVYALNGLTGQTVWRFDTAGEAMPTPVYRDGSLFFDTGDGHLYALNATTGKVESSFANPDAGFSSMSSANFYETASGSLYVIYGTQAPFGGTAAGSNLVAVNETDPGAPRLAWSYNVSNGINTGLGDVPPAVDQSRGLVLTDALVNTGTARDVVLNLEILAVNATTGSLVWSQLAGGVPAADAGFVPVAFKGSVPMVHGGDLYVGDLLNQTYQSYSETTGKLRWEDQLQGYSSRDLPGTVHQPRGGSVYWEGKIIEAEGLHIWTFDPATGKVLNDFIDPGYFGVWGITSPVIVGGEMFLGSISGWIFAVPASYVTSNPGPGPATGVSSTLSGGAVPTTAVVPPNPASYYDPSALPTSAETAGFPATYTAYAGGQAHNGVVASKLGALSFQTALPDAIPLVGPALDTSIYGSTVAGEMTELAFGASTGVTPANGILYVGSNRYTIEALNATTGAEIWAFDTINSNIGQPLVTPYAVVVSSGDEWFNFKQAQEFIKATPGLHVGASLQAIHGLNPVTGQELWTFYTQATDAMTPLYANGNLYWVDGKGNVWAINAATGKPLGAPFENSAGNPTLNLGGVNVVDSANVYDGPGGAVMVVGTADPAALYGIDLSTDTVAWKLSTLPGNLVPYATGYAASSPAVDTSSGLVVTDLLVNAPSPTAPTGAVTSEAVAIDAATGAVAWTQRLGTGGIPYGYTAATPLLSGGRVFFADPVSGEEVALSLRTGTVLWRTPLPGVDTAPGVVVGRTLVQPAGADLVTLDTANGSVLNVADEGGAFLDDAPTVVGKTLYVGNSWGWVLATPVAGLRA